MLVFDVETLSTESTCVVLSAAIVFFDENSTYESIVENSIFVKFDAKEQIQKYKRTVSDSTLQWWSKQCDYAKNKSLVPTKNDVATADGIELLRNYLKNDPSPNKIIWARGSLDQMAIDSLCHSVGVQPLVNFNCWRDVRTAVDILSTTSTNGYCEVSLEGFTIQKVIKHDPVHDCAYDAVQLLYPI
tara:strand:+ start:605 stop:1165 length:561 start_codon:yes stop_codon:yes gene_type:complete